MDLVAKGLIQEAQTFFNRFREDHEKMYLRDIQKLEGVLSPAHLEEMEFAHFLRQSKVNIKICQYAYEMLLQYLHKTQTTVTLGIINERINFKVFPGQPSSISDDAELVTPTGSTQDTANQKNKKEVQLGLLEDSLEEPLENAAGGETKVMQMKIRYGTWQSWDNRLAIDENDMSTSDQMTAHTNGKMSYALFQGHSGPVHSATFSPIGDFVLSSSADTTNSSCSLVRLDIILLDAHYRTSRIWSMDRIQPLRIMAGHLSDVDCVQWHANGKYIATGASDKTVRLWDVQSGECVRIFIGHRSMILSLAMSPDGWFMASGDEDGTIIMWDLSTGRSVTPLIGHTSCVWTLSFRWEGSLLASGSADCTVKLWDVTSSTKASRTDENKSGTANRLRSLKTLPTESTPVYSLQFSRRNLLFAVGALSRSASTT